MPLNRNHVSAERRQLVERYRSISDLVKSFYAFSHVEYNFLTDSEFCRLPVTLAHREIERVIGRFNSHGRGGRN